MDEARLGIKRALIRVIPLVMLVSLLGWCTHVRQSQQASLPIRAELADMFLAAGLAESGDADLNKVAKRAGESSLNRLFYDGASTASLSALKWLASHGADPQHIGALDKGTLLQRAASNPTYERLNYFIDDLGLDPSPKTPDGLSLMHIAAQGGLDINTLKLLKSKGLSVRDTDRVGRQPIHHAALKSIAPLIQEGASIDAPDALGRTALHWAVEGGREDAVAELIRLGASVFVADKSGDTPLHLAALKRSDNMADVLLAAGAPRTARNADGLTPREVLERANEQRRHQHWQSDLLNKL
jgi:ankyrin repeat protein